MNRWCRAPMEWGRDDCALSVANIVRDVMGYDPLEEYRELYRQHDRAALLDALGPSGIARAARGMARRHGWRRVKASSAEPGDIGFVLSPAEWGEAVPATVMCRAPGWFVGRSDFGAAMTPAVNPVNPRLSVKLCFALV